MNHRSQNCNNPEIHSETQKSEAGTLVPRFLWKIPFLGHLELVLRPPKTMPQLVGNQKKSRQRGLYQFSFLHFKGLYNGYHCCSQFYFRCNWSISSSLFTIDFFSRIVPGDKTPFAPILELSPTKAPNFSTPVSIIVLLYLIRILLFSLSL